MNLAAAVAGCELLRHVTGIM